MPPRDVRKSSPSISRNTNASRNSSGSAEIAASSRAASALAISSASAVAVDRPEVLGPGLSRQGSMSPLGRGTLRNNIAGRRPVQSDLALMKTKTYFAFRVDVLGSAANSIIEHVLLGHRNETPARVRVSAGIAVTFAWCSTATTLSTSHERRRRRGGGRPGRPIRWHHGRALPVISRRSAAIGQA